MMLGNPISDDIFQERTDEEDNAATAIHVKLLIEDCKKLLIPDLDSVLGSWGLIDADPVYVFVIFFFFLFLFLFIYSKQFIFSFILSCLFYLFFKNNLSSFKKCY